MSDPAIDYMASRGISEATLLEHGVHYDATRHAVCFPYLDVLLRPVAVRWRALDPGTGPKYLTERGAILGLYNVADVDSEHIYVCEGEIDTLTLKDSGRAAVGIPGAMNFRDAWRWLFVDRHVLVVLDGDKAGRDGAARIARLVSTVARDVSVLQLPDGQDVNSLYVAGTLEGYL